MLKNFFKIAIRKFLKHKVYSLINVIGLGVGLAACFLIYLYVHFETTYDDFNRKGDRIYRLVTDIKTPTDLFNWSSTSGAMAINILKDFPEVESAVRISGENFLVRRGEHKYQEKNAIMADSTLFQMFDFPLIHGNRRTALQEPMSVVLTQSTAKKYFGSSNPIGESVLLTEASLPAKVTGVIKDIPENSQLQADMILSMSSQPVIYKRSIDSAWTNFSLFSYLLLRPGQNFQSLEAKFPNFLSRHVGAHLKADNMSLTLFLEPLTRVHLYSKRDGSKTGNIQNVYVFSIIGVFILLLASINFINLSTARSVERAAEVGIRKVAGAGKLQLAKQFIGESIMTSFIAWLLSIGVSAVTLPLFNQLAGKQVSTPFFYHPLYLVLLLCAALAIGLFAGIYPAFVLTSFKPVEVLKGRFTNSSKGILLRKSLVVLQFTISVLLIIGTIIVYTQLSFMRNQNLGFNKARMLVVETGGQVKHDVREAFKESVSSIAGVESTSFSSDVPGGEMATAYSKIEDRKGDLEVASLEVVFVDFNYLDHYKLKLLAGRGFSKSYATDTSQAMVINETASKSFGYNDPKQAIGKKFDQWGRKGKIIGVIKDFHYRGLQQAIKPMCMRIEPDGYQKLSVLLDSKDISSVLKSIATKWDKSFPGRPFEYSFLDETFDKQYRDEERFGSLFLNFAILAILISCLGILGLSSYSTLQRTKEIGVRKVLGGTVLDIINLLSTDFLKLVLIAIVVASPIAWIGMNSWLKDFAYRTQIVWWMFVVAGLISLFIAFFTISFQAIKAAVANPVKSLRIE